MSCRFAHRLVLACFVFPCFVLFYILRYRIPLQRLTLAGLVFCCCVLSYLTLPCLVALCIALPCLVLFCLKLKQNEAQSARAESAHKGVNWRSKDVTQPFCFA